MKHIIVLLLTVIFYTQSIWSQEIDFVDMMHHDDDTLDVNYTKKLLQGKVWKSEEITNIEDGDYLCMTFKGDSLLLSGLYEGQKYDLPCVFYLSDSYLMDFDDEMEDSNGVGNYLQVKCLDAGGDGTGRASSMSYWIRKLTHDTLEIVEWKSQNSTMRFHAKSLP